MIGIVFRLAFKRDVARLAASAVFSFLVWRLPWIHAYASAIITGIWANELFHIASCYGMLLSRACLLLLTTAWRLAWRHRMLRSRAWQPLLPITAVCAFIYFHPSIVSSCSSDGRSAGMCRAMAQQLRSSGETRVIVQRIKYDHADARVASGALQFVQQAVDGLRGRATIHTDDRRHRMVPETGDLIVRGVAGAWDPDDASGRYRARLMLFKRNERGELDALGQFRIGTLLESAGFTINAGASYEDEHDLPGREMRWSIGRTTLEGCGFESSASCYRGEAIDRALEPMRSGRDPLVRLVVIEARPNSFVAVATH